MTASLLIALLLNVPCEGEPPRCRVEATVGSTTMKMIVDTGADVTVLSESAARRAGIRVERNSPITLIQGVNGVSAGVLSRVRLKVGSHAEEDVLVVVAPELHYDGLLGMSFLERYRVSMGAKTIDLQPIDDGEPKRGGRGQSWWSLRFRMASQRLARYQAMLPEAKLASAQIKNTIGTDPEELTMEDLVSRLERFMREELDKLTQEAARHAVPHEWRR